MALTYRTPRTNLFGTAQNDATGGPTTQQSTKDSTRLRKANPLNQLLPATQRWAAELPEPIRPVHLIRSYPRIANRIARSWNDPKALHEVLNELVIDNRGGRQGFSPSIMAELLRFREFVDGAHSTSFRP